MKLCFVALNAGPYLTEESITRSGGIELQQVTLALKLRDLGYNISFILLDEGDIKKGSIHEGINLIRAYRGDSGIPVFRFFYPRLTSLWKALKEVDADIYIQAGAGFITGGIAYFCKRNRRKFVFWVSNERDVNRSYIEGREFEGWRRTMNRIRLRLRDGVMYRYGLERANAIISQNEYQKAQLMQNHGLESTIIKTGVVVPPERELKKDGRRIIWVANIREIKNPLLFLELARRVPEGHFQMIGGPKSKDLYNKTKKEAEGISNLDFLGHVPYNEIGRYYEEASILVNTSVSEGGPIIFQEAWMRNVPVVSLNVDPDECICKYRLGFHSRTFEGIVSHVRLLLDDEDLRREMGANGRKFVEENHDIEKVVEKYIEVFNFL